LEFLVALYSEIDINTVKEMLEYNSANIVDIRDPESHAKGRIPNSINLDGNNSLISLGRGIRTNL